MFSLPLTLCLGLVLLNAFAVVVTHAETDPPSAPPTVEKQSPAALPASTDLRPIFEKYGLSQRRQGSRGTCSVFAVTGALEFAVANQQKRGTRLSVEFLNWAGHKAVNRTADGGFFSELWKGYEAFGICPEEDQPYQHHFDVHLQPEATTREHAEKLRSLSLTLHWIKEWDVHTGLTDAQIAEIKATLAKQWPVCGGFRWPKQAVWKESVLQMCPPEEVFDGHSVLLVGYRDDPQQPGGGVFLMRNSGGDGSDGYMPYAYVQEYMNDAAWIGTQSKPRKDPQRATEPGK
ncbi:MAG TPA: C1 family peptidase [Chthonomonadaceae bacterium]|nr:C1 family peptidase [Chthonomonadaceae bacterium]